LGKDEIIDFLLAEYSDTKAVSAWGESSIFYNPNNRLPRGVYFATLKDKDGENDRASSLNRDSQHSIRLCPILSTAGWDGFQ